MDKDEIEMIKARLRRQQERDDEKARHYKATTVHFERYQKRLEEGKDYLDRYPVKKEKKAPKKHIKQAGRVDSWSSGWITGRDYVYTPEPDPWYPPWEDKPVSLVDLILG